MHPACGGATGICDPGEVMLSLDECPGYLQSGRRDSQSRGKAGSAIKNRRYQKSVPQAACLRGMCDGQPGRSPYYKWTYLVWLGNREESADNSMADYRAKLEEQKRKPHGSKIPDWPQCLVSVISRSTS